jgi:putative membrane-bound dehydrogenase-like protein
MPHHRLLVLAMLAALCTAAIAQEPVRGLPSLRVPEGFTVEVAATHDLSAYPMFMNFDSKGRLFIAESSGKDLPGPEMVEAPECQILMLEDMDEDGVFDRRTVYADKLSLPMGVLPYGEYVYVCSPPDFLRFRDSDGDGVADEREVLLTGWNVLNTASLHGPFVGPDGWLYLTHGRHGYKIKTKEGELLEGQAARIWRCRPDGSRLERFCGGGFDNPIEIVMTHSGELIGTMTYFTDPMNGQRDALMHWVEGGVYPKPHESVREFTRTGELLPPLTRFARIAPSGLWHYEGLNFGPEFRGNLFSAQFNSHRVQRHVLTRRGASYVSEDTDFLSSIDPDFHPTDVVEDGDGSLLVCDTGGWYVDACPVSRVAKPEIRGSIYRIRRAGSPRVDDPYGKNIPYGSLSVDELIARLTEEQRPRVIQNLAIAVIMHKDPVEKALYRLYEESANERLRHLAYNLLIQRPVSQREMLAGLSDPDPDIRIAACRYAAQELISEEAAERVAQLLRDEAAHVRLQAALSLRAFDLPSTAPALLEACAGEEDPFLRHALIYALMETADGAALAQGAEHADPGVRRAAMITADNLGLLDEEAFARFLADTDPDMRKDALWVASRHPEWEESIGNYLQDAIARWTPGQGDSLTELLLAFAGQPRVQEAMAGAVNSEDIARAEYLLGVMEQSSLKPLPARWIKVLRTQLEQGAPLRARAVQVVRGRVVEGCDRELKAIAQDAANPHALRLAALDATLARGPELDDATFAYVSGLLAPGHEAPTRQAAARLLARSTLSPAQAKALARDTIPTADALIFGSVLDAIARQHDEAVGAALVAALRQASMDITRLPARRIEGIFANYPESVRESAAPLLAPAQAAAEERVAKLQALVPRVQEGDVGRGRQIFFGEKVACSTCHAIGSEGGRLGPDLTTIGVIRSAHDIAEAILFPSASIVQGYESWQVRTEWEAYTGVIGREGPEGITLRTAAAEESYLARGDILSMEEYPVSIMPEGLDQALTQQEMLDLLAFLVSLNNEPWLLAEKRETK